MLELQKKVLQNVADNKATFKKELYKSIGWLSSDELSEFLKWVKENFWTTHKEIVQEVFFKYAV